MFNLASEAIEYFRGHRTTMACKIMQTTGNEAGCQQIDPMEGSVARCTVSGSVLTKLHHADAARGLASASRAFRAAGWLLEITSIAGSSSAMSDLASACDLELDVQRELFMQQAFRAYALQTHPNVRIPEPLGTLPDGTGLTMEYLAETRRFCDCTDARDRARAVVLVSRLFFGAIADCGLVHGDVSPTNVLVDVEGRPCLVDFGCCFQSPDGGKAFLQARQRMTQDGMANNDNGLVMRVWEDRAWCDGWAAELDAVSLTSLSFNGDENIPGISLYLRSLLALTMMARQVPPNFLRAEELIWKKDHQT